MEKRIIGLKELRNNTERYSFPFVMKKIEKALKVLSEKERAWVTYRQNGESISVLAIERKSDITYK